MALNNDDFDELRKAVHAEDAQREVMIKRSRDVLKLSKTSIFALHRGDTTKANKQLTEAQKIAVEELFPIVEKYPHLRFGSLANSLEEFAEARIFQAFLATGRVPSRPELEIVSAEEYLGGLLDFTGELNRVAIRKATERDTASVSSYRDVVDDIMQQMTLFDFRNGALRKKFDGLKYTLKKLETVIYELSLTSALGGVTLGSTAMEAARPREDDADDDAGASKRQKV